VGALRRRGFSRAADDLIWAFSTASPGRPHVDREVDDELAFHLDMRTREYIERGIDPAAARREAEKRFGNVGRTRAALEALGKGRNRHMQRTEYVSELRQDIAFACRQFVKNPGFTAVAVLCRSPSI
jgi:putative ABC transport system permease protein